MRYTLDTAVIDAAVDLSGAKNVVTFIWNASMRGNADQITGDFAATEIAKLTANGKDVEIRITSDGAADNSAITGADLAALIDALRAPLISGGIPAAKLTELPDDSLLAVVGGYSPVTSAVLQYLFEGAPVNITVDLSGSDNTAVFTWNALMRNKAGAITAAFLPAETARIAANGKNLILSITSDGSAVNKVITHADKTALEAALTDPIRAGAVSGGGVSVASDLDIVASYTDTPTSGVEDFNVTGAAVRVSAVGDTAMVTITKTDTSPFASFVYTSGAAALLKDKNVTVVLNTPAAGSPLPVTDAHWVRQASLGAGAVPARLSLSTNAARFSYDGITLVDTHLRVEGIYSRQVSEVYEPYANNEVMIEGITVKKYPLDTDTYDVAVYNGAYALSFSKDIEVENIRLHTEVHHDLGIELTNGARLYPAGGKTWSDIAVDGRIDVSLSMDLDGRSYGLEKSRYFGALAALGFDYENDPNVPTLKHWTYCGSDGYVAQQKYGTPIPNPKVALNAFANGHIKIMRYYKQKGKFDNIKYFVISYSFADGRAVPGATTTPLVINGAGNPAYPAYLDVDEWERLSGPKFNLVVKGVFSTGPVSPMGNIAFLNDQTGGWSNITARGVIAFNGHAPSYIEISGADSLNSHGYIILNKVRTDGTGANIKGAGVLDVRKVLDTEIDNLGDIGSSPGLNSGILILKNKTAASKLSAGIGILYKAVALTSAGGSVKALDGDINIGSNVVQDPMQAGYVFEGNAKVWMDALNTALTNNAYAEYGYPQWYLINSEPAQSQPLSSQILDAAAFSALNADVPSSATWQNANLIPNTPAYAP